MDSPTLAVPAGFVALEIGKGCQLVIPERVYLAGLKLGKALRRREAEAKRAAMRQGAPGLPIGQKGIGR